MGLLRTLASWHQYHGHHYVLVNTSVMVAVITPVMGACIDSGHVNKNKLISYNNNSFRESENKVQMP